MADEVMARHGRIDVLANGAGVTTWIPAAAYMTGQTLFINGGALMP
jgi:NAD(P)-dependent dehydrogenase (short-subunit alcohol dehydrogenase family)